MSTYDPAGTITHSMILAFSCGARFEKLFVQGLRDESDPARRGSTIHTANEFYLKKLVATGCTSDPEAARDAFHEAIVAESTPAHLVPECEDLWLGWVELFQLDLAAFLEAEQRRGATGFSFKPDMVFARENSLDIDDLKTHYQGLTEAAAKRDLQARMYAYLASQTWPGFPEYRFTFRFIRLRQSVTAVFKPDELDAIGRQLAAHADGIAAAHKAGVWPAAPGDQCKFCTFKCDAVDHAAREPVRLLTAEDAVKTAGELAVLQQAVTLKKRALEGYCGLNGPVVLETTEWAHRPTVTLSFPAAEVVDVLRAKECDVSKLSVGKTALKSYLTAKKWAHVTPLLEVLAKTRSGTKFSAKKLGATGDEPEEGDA